ncbi:hypothetical protein, partial [Negativibacillus massiliensis]|uniref:hypothetical protein n=1 Tax=Negativibacillus massiliensis TaxID=1871035 RepID=UPI003AF30222
GFEKLGNVTVSAKTKFLVVALENVALLHSPKVLRNWVTLQSLLKQNFSSLPSRMSRCSIEEISKRKYPLGYAFADFSRKRKVSASVGGMSPHQQSIPFDERLG